MPFNYVTHWTLVRKIKLVYLQFDVRFVVNSLNYTIIKYYWNWEFHYGHPVWRFVLSQTSNFKKLIVGLQFFKIQLQTFTSRDSLIYQFVYPKHDSVTPRNLFIVLCDIGSGCLRPVFRILNHYRAWPCMN